MFKKRNKIRVVLLSVVLIIILLYLAMFLSTNSVIDYVERVFNGDVPEETNGTPLAPYNIHKIYGNEYKEQRGASELQYEYRVNRLFVLHDFFDGYVWIKYEFFIKDENGVVLAGTIEPIARLTIHRENGEWIVTEVNERP